MLELGDHKRLLNLNPLFVALKARDLVLSISCILILHVLYLAVYLSFPFWRHAMGAWGLGLGGGGGGGGNLLCGNGRYGRMGEVRLW